MTWICVAIMVVGFIGMIVCSKKQKTNPAMQPVAIVLCLVVLGAAAGLLWDKMGDSFTGNSSVMKSEFAFLASRGYAAGTHLAKVAPGKRSSLSPNPTMSRAPRPRT